MVDQLQEWEKVRQRYQQYKDQYQKLLNHFGDELSMEYFSDRFGSNNPMSQNAEQGIALRQRLRKMEVKMLEFVTEFCTEFPELEE